MIIWIIKNYKGEIQHKKILRFSICFLLIVSLLSAFAVNSSATITSTTTHKTETGMLAYLKGTYAYSIDTAASTHAASASMSFGRSALLYAKVEASVTHNNKIEIRKNEDAITGYEISVSVNSNYPSGGVNDYGIITAVVSEYIIGRAIASFTHTIT